MKKLFLLKLSMLVTACMYFTETSAQLSSLMEPRLLVNSPSAIAGGKSFTYSSDASGGWGGLLDTATWFNKEVVIGNPSDSLVCTGGAANSVAGKWALIWRGDCEFGAKAKNAQDKGAEGVIIIQNLVGEGPVGMGAGAQGGLVNIPVLMVGYNDGLAMWNQLKSSQQVFISLSRWGFGFGSDLAIVPNSATVPPYFAIPLTQINTTSSPVDYRAFTGAFVANVGTNTQTNLKLVSTGTFTPNGGSPSTLYSDTVTASQVTVNDSIIEMFSTNVHNLSATQMGKFDFNFSLTSDSTDLQESDNSVIYTTHVTPHVFSMGRYDMVKQEPIVSINYKRADNNPLVWGPLYYNSNGGYYAEKIQFSISDGVTGSSLLGGSAVFLLYKWTDGANGGTADNIMQGTELSLKGIAEKSFSELDSNNDIFTATIKDPSTNGKVITESNSWYWIAMDMDGTYYLGCDGNLNFYTRTVAAANASPSSKDFWAPSFFGTNADIALNGSLDFNMFPFIDATNNPDSVGFVGQKGVVPAVPLYISQFPASVKETASQPALDFNVYPNPAVDQVSVKFNFDAESKVTIRIADAFGRTVIKETRENINKNSNATISVKSLAAGNYYILVDANRKVVAQQFTIAK